MSSNKSVRFSANTKAGDSAKRPRDVFISGEPDDDCDGDENLSSKRARLDDDSWDGPTEVGGDIPSEKELLEAKRRRRQQQDQQLSKGGTHIDTTTSLQAEGVTIEPFHMREEEEDGTGYFEGDTYVFRKNADGDEEPDAWLDTLREEAENGRKSDLATTVGARGDVDDKDDDSEKMSDVDTLSKDRLYEKVLSFLGEKETVSQAVRRYGKIVKHHNHGKKPGVAPSSEVEQLTAKKYLYDLTGAANALLLKGEVDIYDTSRATIFRKLPWLLSRTSYPAARIPPASKQPPAQWEYMGNQDGKLHGPYTTEQMIGWTQAGYFVGDQKVKVRTLREGKLSTEDDLMADLMEDDEDGGHDGSESKPLEKGEWLWSTEVDFRAFLP